MIQWVWFEIYNFCFGIGRLFCLERRVSDSDLKLFRREFNLVRQFLARSVNSTQNDTNITGFSQHVNK